MIGLFKCLNPQCGECWSINEKNQLVPGLYEQNALSGGWQQKEESLSCPSCSDDWKWDND
ncbi:hypothetical protein EV210_101131 [Anaerospora hongkongensis]|uniref:Uncharacterized protein n=1 Tax=Anaerospora hongkongensis TaxID=244830 RepID=A0A4V2Q930_9FIRM|nr:hypothetical protein EV210_101131 [Anaerospora hongkongensis]